MGLPVHQRPNDLLDKTVEMMKSESLLFYKPIIN